MPPVALRPESRSPPQALTLKLNAQDQAQGEGSSDFEPLGAGLADPVDLEELQPVQREQHAELSGHEEPIGKLRAILSPVVD